MALYEKRLQSDLADLNQEVREMGEMVETGINNAVRALLSDDKPLANQTVIYDHPINRKMRHIDHLCNSFIARHLPSGGHLRQISSIARMNIALERIGDYAVTISREAMQLSAPMNKLLAHEVESIASEATGMLHQAMTAYYDENAEMARATKTISANMETLLDGVYASLIDGEYKGDPKSQFIVFAVLTQLKRVADQAKNICEDIIFAFTGETKEKYAYSILFVDEDNACFSQMAEAIARKHYPNSGHYMSAGRKAAKEIDPKLIAFLHENGIDIDEDSSPKSSKFAHHDLIDHHVVVALQGKVTDYSDDIPFHTAALDWDLGLGTKSATKGKGKKAALPYDEIYRELSHLIRDLMEVMRGKDAD